MPVKPKIEVVIQTKDQFINFVNKWMDHDWESDPRNITNKRFVRKKSNPQVNAIHGLIRRIAEHSGDEFEYLKEALKEEFGPVDEIDHPWKHGEYLEVPKSIADYNVEEASDFISRILYLSATHYDLILEIEG